MERGWRASRAGGARTGTGMGARPEGGGEVRTTSRLSYGQINNVVIVNALDQHAAGLHWRLFFAIRPIERLDGCLRDR